MLRIESTQNTPVDGFGVFAAKYYEPTKPALFANLKELIAQGFSPIIRLHPGHTYPMSDEALIGRVDREGHVVAIIGYDHSRRAFEIADPWDKDVYGGSIGGTRWIGETDTIFKLVNSSLGALTCGFVPQAKARVHAGVGSVVIFELEVPLGAPAPLTLLAERFEAIEAQIELPEGLRLAAGNSIEKEASRTRGDSVDFEWSLTVEGPFKAGAIRTTVTGTASGSEPYEWSDRFGVATIANLVLVSPQVRATAGI